MHSVSFKHVFSAIQQTLHDHVAFNSLDKTTTIMLGIPHPQLALSEGFSVSRIFLETLWISPQHNQHIMLELWDLLHLHRQWHPLSPGPTPTTKPPLRPMRSITQTEMISAHGAFQGALLDIAVGKTLYSCTYIEYILYIYNYIV